MCEEKEVVLDSKKQEQPKYRSFDMQMIVEDILKVLEKNTIPLAALDWVFQHVKEEAARRVTVSSKLPFQLENERSCGKRVKIQPLTCGQETIIKD